MFTRQEAMKLSRLTTGKISYLDKTGLVSPQKVGSESKPTCLYSWEQIIELRTIFKLRQDASLYQLRQAKSYLERMGESGSLASKILYAINNEIYLLESGEIEKTLIKISGKNQGQVIIHALFPISEVIKEVWNDGVGNVKDFTKRAKDRPADVAA